MYVRQLADALVKLGHRVDLVTLWRRAEHPHETAPQSLWTWSELGNHLHLLEITLPQTVDATKNELPEHLGLIANTVQAAYRDIGQETPDVVHGHYWLSAVVALMLAQDWDVPAVATFHTTALAKNQRAGVDEAPEPQLRADAERTVLQEAAGIVVNTDTEARALIELYGAAPETVKVIAPGVDTTVFHPAPEPGEPGVAPSPAPEEQSFTIGFAGRLQALKGPHILISAVHALRQDRPELAPQVWIAGVGPQQFTADLESSIRDGHLEDVVKLVGSISVGELAQRFRNSDVVAAPSSSETFGLVALEAQACGTPVVATDVDGLRHAVVDGETGWLVPERSAAAWAKTLAEVAADPEERERRGKAAAGRAQRFSWSANARAHVQLYADLRARHPRVEG